MLILLSSGTCVKIRPRRGKVTLTFLTPLTLCYGY